MIRVDAVWLALGVSDLRGGIDVLLGQVVRGFAGGAQPHSAYVFANRRADRLKAEPGHKASRGRLVPGEGPTLRVGAACKAWCTTARECGCASGACRLAALPGRARWVAR